MQNVTTSRKVPQSQESPLKTATGTQNSHRIYLRCFVFKNPPRTKQLGCSMLCKVRTLHGRQALFKGCAFFLFAPLVAVYVPCKTFIPRLSCSSCNQNIPIQSKPGARVVPCRLPGGRRHPHRSPGSPALQLVHGGVPFLLVLKKPCFKWLQHGDLLRSSAEATQKTPNPAEPISPPKHRARR